MTNRRSKEKAKKSPSSVRPELSYLLRVTLNYLKDQATDLELMECTDLLLLNLQQGNQPVLDFLKSEIEEKDPSLLENWDNLMESLTCSSEATDSLDQEFEHVLFLVPIVFGVESKLKDQHDQFEIVQHGKLQELMKESGFISQEGETVSFLPRLFSFDEAVLMPETEKFKSLQFLISGGKKYEIASHLVRSSCFLQNVLDLKMKMMVGCARLRLYEPVSPLAYLIHPLGDETDHQLDKCAQALVRFSSVLTERLPSFLNKREGIEVVVSAVSSVTQFNKSGLRIAIREYDRYKWNFFFEQAKLLNSPRISINQSNPEFINLSLFENKQIVDHIQINSLCESHEEMFEFLNEFFEDLEAREFFLESDSNEELVFSKKGKKKSFRENQPTGFLH